MLGWELRESSKGSLGILLGHETPRSWSSP